MEILKSAIEIVSTGVILVAALLAVAGLIFVGWGMLDHDGGGMKKGLAMLAGAAVIGAGAGLLLRIPSLLPA